MDAKLQNIIEGIFTRCISDGEFKQVSCGHPRATFPLNSCLCRQ